MKKHFRLFVVLVLFAMLGAGCFFRKYCLVQDLLVKGDTSFDDEKFLQMYPASVFLDKKKYLDLGWLSASLWWEDVVPSYLKASLQKKPHTIRIGIFGGSMAVYGGLGKEKEYSWPALLQENFKKEELNDVEVINFGVPAYGLSQQYNLWNSLGRFYDLDYVIFSIHDIYWVRDLNLSQNPLPHYGPLHGRYILTDNNELKLISPAGSTRKEALSIYYSLFPRLRYLRYEKSMPLCLKTILPTFLHNRVNPFYYRVFTSERAELLPIYTAIFKEVALKARNLIILAADGDASYLRKRIKEPNVSIFTPKAKQNMRSFLYFGDMYHTNILGNQIAADEFFAYLRGKNTWSSLYLELIPQIKSIKARGPFFRSPLFEYKQLLIKEGSVTVAYLVSRDDKSFLNVPPSDLFSKQKKISSFISFHGKDFRNEGLLPLSFPLTDDETVFLVVSSGGRTDKTPIGRVHAVAGSLGEIEFDSRVVKEFNWEEQKLIVHNDKSPKKAGGLLKDFSILIGEKRIFDARLLKEKFSDKGLERSFSIKEAFFERVYFRTGDIDFIDGNSFEKKEGVLDFVLVKENGQEERCPIFFYKVVPFEKSLSDVYNGLFK